jgi:plasmid stabilization system protein ParE
MGSAWRLSISTAAELDLLEIETYRASFEGFLRAKKVMSSIFDALERLEFDPFRWPVYTLDDNGREIRRFIFNSTYSVHYTVEVDEKLVVIQRIWHSARDPKEL